MHDQDHILILGATELVLVRSIATLGSNAYGAAIQRHVEASIGKRITFGQIYTTLERLEAKGLLHSTISKPEPVRGGRAKRVFQLEERGRLALDKSTANYAMVLSDKLEMGHAGEGKPCTA